MNRPRRPGPTVRSRVFIGCEGESEQGYVRWLGTVADNEGLRIHLANPLMRQSGDVLGMVTQATKKLRVLERMGDRFIEKALLLDQDMAGKNTERDKQAAEIAQVNALVLLWQRPDFEGLLLRHFPGHEQASPPKEESIKLLKKLWPQYNKGQSASEIEKRLGIEDLKRACKFEHGLAEFLRQIGFPV